MSAVVSTADTTRTAVTQLLTQLGDDPNTVAQRLHAAGIRGERCNEGTCPIATYLLASDLRLARVQVIGNIAVFGDPDRPFALGEYVKLSDAVDEFIHRFDNGAYPQLLAVTR
jgi:hypothetical protein